MAVQLTRKQYEELYGSKPVFTGSDSTFEPTPIRMTQDEYNKLYPKKQYEAPRGFGIKETALAGIENIQTGLQKTFGAAEVAKPQEDIFDEGLAKGTIETLFRGLRAGSESVIGLGRTVGGIAQVGLAPILGPLNIAGEKIGETIGRALPVGVGSAAEATAKNPLAMQALEDILDLSNLAVPEVGARAIKSLEPVQKAIEIKLQSGELTPPQVRTFIEDRVSNQALKDLQDLKTKNAKLRNNQFFDDASIKRISDAQAKTGFLNSATDYDGTIRTKDTGIAQKYRELTIDGADGVVRQLLKREGAKVNINEISSAMRVAADLKYEGADLVNALRGIEKELAGLSERADEFGDISLDKVQDMKIASTQYVDYTKPASASFRKLKGSVYRQIIEDKSNATIQVDGKQKTIKDINAELQKYYRDIENLEALDGLKVKGGRLGKYFSQTIGALIGSSAGQVAGPLGSAVGGILGAEAGGAIRGAQLSRAFGRGRQGDLAPNTLLQKAKEVGKKEPVVDLRKPDVKVGVPSNIPKTKEIQQVEARIARNVEEQKKAIAAKDYTLVATLKEVYKALVEKLKDLIDKASRSTARGFARLDLGQSKSEGSRKSTQANTNGKTSSSTGVNDTISFPGIPKELAPLAQEAKKYKSAEEFVKAMERGGSHAKGTDSKYGGYNLYPNEVGSWSIADIARMKNGDFTRGFEQLKLSNADKISSYKYLSQDPVNGKVNIYRVVPEGKTINAGDYVFTDRNAAQDYLEKYGKERGATTLVQQKAGLDELLFTDIPTTERKGTIAKDEFIYAPKSVQNLNLTDLWNKVHGGTTQAFEGFSDLSTKLLEKLKGRTTVSKQFISDLTNSPDLKQPERDLIRNLLEGEGKDVSVPDFANKVKSELLPLKINKPFHEGTKQNYRYENITLPAEQRGFVANYEERIYESPFRNYAGDKHFSAYNTSKGVKITDSQNYFAHTRIEDMADGNTRRVIEAQSDLFQKGGLEKEMAYIEPEIKRLTSEIEYDKRLLKNKSNYIDRGYRTVQDVREQITRNQEQLSEAISMKREAPKVEPYRNTWHERVIREEVKQAAIDGKTKLQFPTGETAMKIEGLGDRTTWTVARDIRGERMPGRTLDDAGLKVGQEIFQGNQAGSDAWIITDVLGDGKFKAVPKSRYEFDPKNWMGTKAEHDEMVNAYSETFDISGKVDTNNPIYKFYEKEVGKYLKNKYGAELVTDAQGVKWWEMKVTPEMKKLPIEAFGLGALPLLDQEDTNK